MPIWLWNYHGGTATARPGEHSITRKIFAACTGPDGMAAFRSFKEWPPPQGPKRLGRRRLRSLRIMISEKFQIFL
jgi:hypothetical protein